MIGDVTELEIPMIPGFRATPTQEPVPEAGVFDTSEVVKAAFRTENSIGSIVSNQVERSKPNADYDPFNDIDGFEEYAMNFANANTVEEVQSIKKQITQEKQDKQLLQESGWQGTLAGLAAGIIDPINLIPVGGTAMKAYSTGGNILKGAAHTARAGLIGSTLSEAALQSTQETRTLGESAQNIAGATLISGVLGGAAGLLGGKKIKSLGEALEKDFEVPHPDLNDIAEPNSVVVNANDSVGAMRANVQTTLEEETLSKAWGVDKLFAKLNPKIRLSTSPSVEVRRFVQELIETPFYYNKNSEGIANPVAIETIVGMQDALLGRAVEFQKKAFSDYRARVKTEDGKKLTYLQFRQQASRAMRRNDAHAIPEVAAVAKKYRAEVIEPVKKEAIRVGLLDPDIKVVTADSYLHRWWDKTIVSARRSELVPILRKGLQGQYADMQESFARKITKNQKNLQSEIDELRTANLRDNQQFIDSGGQFTEREIMDAITSLQNPPKKPETLLSFLQKNGGLKESSGELRTIGITQKTRPGFVNKNGMNLDDAALKAWENGFLHQFDERPEVNDLLEAIRNDYEGNLIVRKEDLGYAREIENLSDIQKALDEIGIDFDRFAGVKRLEDFNLGDVKKKINDITAARRMRKIENLTTKYDSLTGEKMDDLADDEFDLMAEEIIDNILGHADTRIPYDVGVSVRGPLKERLLSFVRDEDVEEFLVNDAEAVMRKYLGTMTPDIAIKERFGELNILDKEGPVISKINENYRVLIDRAKTEKQKKALEANRKSDLEDVEAMVSQLRGTYGVPENPDSIIVRTARSVRNAQYISKLGGMTASAFADVARPVMVHGMARSFMDGFLPLITNLKGLKLAAREVKEAGAAWEMVSDSRSMTLAEVNNPYVKGNRFEKGLQAMADGFGKVALMTQWNTAMKQFSGVITQARIIKAVQAGDKISKKDARYLNMIGIDATMSKRIAAMVGEFGQDFRGTMVANTQKWTDPLAAVYYRAAIKKEVNRIIVEPGHGDIPLILKGTEAGKIVGQFRSFSFAATNKMLISGLQEGDIHTLNGWVMAVGMGMVSYAFKQWDKGQELSDDPRVWLLEGVDRSGILAILSEVNQLGNKFTDGRVSLQGAVGLPPLTRYESSNFLGVLLGPTVGTLEDLRQVSAGVIGEGKWTQSDSRALRRMIPYQNLMVARQLFDYFESSINESMGVSR